MFNQIKPNILEPISRDRSDRLPLSFTQQRVWFLAQIDEVSEAYHIPFNVRLAGFLDSGALGRALDRILARHEALRTCFRLIDGKPVQCVSPAHDVQFILLESDLRQHPDGIADLDRLVAEEAAAPFDLENGPLIRGRLIHLSDIDHTLLITMHHIVSDGWSMDVLINELSVLYSAFHNGFEDPLPDLKIQYADYAVWQRKWLEGEILQRQAVYWKRTLENAPALLQLPTDHLRPTQQSYAGAFVGWVLDEALTAGLRDLSRRSGTTLFMTLLSAWAILLTRLSGQQDVVIGTPTANRGRAEVEGLIGLFVNTLALRVDVSGSLTVRELLAQVKKSTIAAQQNQEIPFEQIVEILRPIRSLAHSPLFQVMFTWQNASENKLSLPGLELRPSHFSVHVVSKFDLTLSLQDTGMTIVGGIEYATSLFKLDTIERHLGYLRTILEGMVADDTLTVGRLPLLSATERRRVPYEWNNTGAEFSFDQCVHELFEEQVDRTPEGVALVFEEDSLTYAELNRRANQLAHYLRALGVRPDDRVAICVERGFEMIIGLLAVLKAGGAYVPLDPAYPVDRLRFMLEDSQPIALLTQQHLAGLFNEVPPSLPVLNLEDTAPWRDLPHTNPTPENIGLTPQSLAYVIYTSGSTGNPKGVLVQQRSLTRLFSATDALFNFNAKDSWTLFHSYAFDFSVWEIWGALLYGGRLVLVSEVTARSPQEFCKLIRDKKITILNQTPSAFRHLISAQPTDVVFPGLRYLIFGGETLEASILKEWYRRYPSTPIRLINMYGITEITIHATGRFLEQADADRVGGSVIGRPLPHLRIYILDEYGEPAPVGVSGELYIGGAGVARGYLNRPELTAEKFLKDSFSSDPEARMYRTGDMGRWLADGNIEFLGRNDSQVKIRGFRIELGEIEARLMEHADVGEAVVIAREDVPGDKRLVAYYTAAGNSPDPERLRSHVSASLPEYMVPVAYVPMKTLPLTPNGKLNREALPAPGDDAYATATYEPPQTETESIVAAIWADLLQLERVGRHDNFFALGGHSLLAITLIERLHQAGLEVNVRAIFAAPVLAELALAAERIEPLIPIPENLIPADCNRIVPRMLPLIKLTQEEIDRLVSSAPGGAANVQDIYPLAPLQEGIFFHYLKQQDGDPYLLVGQLSFDSRGRLDRYIDALEAVIHRHDILRTAIRWEGLYEPVQLVLRKVTLPLEEVLLPCDEDIAGQLYAQLDPRHYRMDVERAPLLRLYIASDSQRQRWFMLMLRHHLTCDHVTLEVLEQEIRAHLLGRHNLLPAPLPFRNMVARARLGVSSDEHKVFFQRMLEDIDEPTAPFGLLDIQGDSKGIEEIHLRIDATLAARLRAGARRLRVSVATICHLAWAQVVAKTSGRGDVVFGTVLFGRGQSGAGSDRAMGLFINTLPIRIAINEEGAEVGVLKVHALLASLLHHEHASLALAQHCSAVSAPTPLFSALLNYRHSPGADQAPSQDTMRAYEGMQVLGGEERTNYPFALSVEDLQQNLGLTAQAPTSIGALRICEFMEMAIASLVHALESAPTAPIHTLEVLPATERRRVLYEWNNTGAEFSFDKCVHELFEEQVDRTPDGVALVFEEDSLAYAELNRRANQLAHYLRALGVRPDDRVAICVERGFEMIIGLLAVLKAGGAYVPLDPAYPVDRLRFMLEDSQPIALLTQQHLAGLFNEVPPSLPILNLGDTAPWGDSPHTNPTRENIGLTPQSLAYVIYTSGSTGIPKGVLVEHKGLANLGAAQVESFAVTTESRILQFASPSFDAYTFEVVLALTHGAALYLVRRRELLAGEALAEIINASGITHITLPPPILASLPSEIDFRTVHILIAAGDTLTDSLTNRWAGKLRIANAYGPTEATIWSTLYKCDLSLSNNVPIGKPIANVQVYILDGYGEPVPVGVPGELYIGGAGVARGYLNRPELTAEKFLKDPFSNDPKARMYRTGDMGRWLADGNIEFLGRNDSQVKIRGFRIEPGEIEARLMEHADVGEAVVIAREDVPGDKRLVAYYTAAGNSPDPERLRSHVSASLPEYMVPVAYVPMKTLPLTPNGKLNREALPAPGDDAYATATYEPPQTETESIVAAIWADLLQLERVGRHDNFFALGGHSLLVLKLTTLLARVDIALSLSDLYKNPTLRALAAQIDSRDGTEYHDKAICIRDGASRAPLFLTHCGEGTLLYANALEPHVEGGIPIYGLPPQPVHESDLLTVPQMASRMVQMIRTIQPAGPYYLAGWSFGGMLAYEIAHQLLVSNESIAFLGLLDTLYPQGLSHTSDHMYKSIFSAALDEKEGLLSQVASNVGQDAISTLDRLRPRAHQMTLSALLSACRIHSLLPEYLCHLPDPEIENILRRQSVFGKAHLSYRAPTIPISMHFFMASSTSATGGYLGWETVLPDGKVRIVPTGGTHHTMMSPPHVAELGISLSRAIAAAGAPQAP